MVIDGDGGDESKGDGGDWWQFDDGCDDSDDDGGDYSVDDDGCDVMRVVMRLSDEQSMWCMRNQPFGDTG